jgi:hypothetical protein
MAKLLINGINVGPLISAGEEPRGVRRDIGDVGQAVDGTSRVSRRARKNDLEFKSPAIDDDEANVWEQFVTGMGEVWNFDVSLYGSKGLGPSASVLATLVTSHPKFGAKNLSLGATTGSITYAAAALNIFGAYEGHTVMVWRYESSAWHHYVVRSDGTIWRDGTTAGSPSASWLSVNTSTGNVVIANTSGGAVEYDDLVVLPFQVFDEWPKVFAAATAAFSQLPFLNLSGDLVKEQAVRSVLGQANVSHVRTGAGTRTKLEVELKAR